jgi:AraC-like DNA-binding protein
VKEVAAALGKHSSDLDRMFWRETGLTVKQLIDRLCKEKIESRLHDGDCKGSQLALELGFRDDQAFYRWIQRVFEMPFKELRIKHTSNH